MKPDELEPALQALLNAERSAPLPGMADAKARFLLKFAKKGAIAAGATKAAITAKTVGVVGVTTGVLGAVLGATITWSVMKPEELPEVFVEAPVDAAVDVPSDAPVDVPIDAPKEEVEPLAVPDDLPEETDVVVVVMEPETREPEAPRPSALARERALIDQARAALRAGRAHDALVALMGHERQFPNGSFAEERERLAIESLVDTGRHRAARRRGDAFLRRYPQSAHRERIERFLRDLPLP
ncbi:MAG: hypothetical protein AAGE52_18895 [Myxococcota bacterium]